MTAERRLAKVEAALTPTQRVLAWLDEAHAHGSLSAYIDSLLAGPPEAFPINRLAREATEAAGAGRSKSSEPVDTAARKALRATLIRFELVMRINVVGHEMIEREALIYAVLASQVGLLLCDDGEEQRSDPSHIRRLAMLRDVTASRVVELLAAQEARSIVEVRYLEGHPALFPDDVLGWAERLQLAQEVALMTERLADLDGAPPAAPVDRDAVSIRARVLIPDLVEPARVVALEKLDETRRAFAFAIDWLRSKAQASGVDDSDTSLPEAPPR